jgi:hypothetical protein
MWEIENKKMIMKNTQKPSLFTTILDMAALDKGSRAGSLSLDNENVNSQTHLLYNHQNGDLDHTNSLASLARRSTMRKRSFR